MFSLLSSILFSFLAVSVAAADTDVQPFLPALGNSQNIQGGSQSLGPFDLLTLTNETHAVLAINVSKPMSEVGYVAVGWGSTMADSLMLIGWPNSDNTWTISRREATGHTQPTADNSTADSQAFMLQSDLSTNDSSLSYSTLTFVRPLNLADVSGFTSTSSNLNLQRASGQAMIYAYGSTNPGSNDETSKITQHDDGAYGSTNVDLSTTVNSSGTVSSQKSSNPWTRYDSLIVLHALCGCLAWLIISPAAVLVARLGRHLHGTWLQLHRALQVILTFVLTLICVILAGVAISEKGGKHFTPGHQLTGLILLILLFIQINLGWIIHHLFNPNRTKRPIRNIAHILLGIILIILGFVQVSSGFKKYNRKTPAYVIAAFILILIFFWIAFIGSVGLLAFDRRKKENRSWSMAIFGLGRDDPAKDRHPGSGDWGTSHEKLTENIGEFPQRNVSTRTTNGAHNSGSNQQFYGEKPSDMEANGSSEHGPDQGGQVEHRSRPIRGPSIRQKVLNRVASLGRSHTKNQQRDQQERQTNNIPPVDPNNDSDISVNMVQPQQGLHVVNGDDERNSSPSSRGSVPIPDEIRQGEAYRHARQEYAQRGFGPESNHRPPRENAPRNIAASTARQQWEQQQSPYGRVMGSNPDPRIIARPAPSMQPAYENGLAQTTSSQARLINHSHRRSRSGSNRPAPLQLGASVGRTDMVKLNSANAESSMIR